jgi:hypothetical protein
MDDGLNGVAVQLMAWTKAANGSSKTDATGKKCITAKQEQVGTLPAEINLEHQTVPFIPIQSLQNKASDEEHKARNK